MKIALFSGLDCHYEMFGYIIYFCAFKKYELTIYCYQPDHQGYIDFFNILFTNFVVHYKEVAIFEKEKYEYNAIFLITDDDYNYDRSDYNINHKTICIDHYYKIRNPIFEKRIAVRPFEKEFYRDWALPSYPIINSELKRELLKTNSINIIVLGCTNGYYDTTIINRIKTKTNKKIIFHAISRNMSIEKFKGISNSFDLYTYSNINTYQLFQILSKANYILTGLTDNKNYTSEIMSGSIPIAFSTLTPLIISKETNSYYKFKNVIEFDKNSENDILLEDIDIQSLESERDELIRKNHELFDSLLQ